LQILLELATDWNSPQRHRDTEKIIKEFLLFFVILKSGAENDLSHPQSYEKNSETLLPGVKVLGVLPLRSADASLRSG
jgi:hypothetical protein